MVAFTSDAVTPVEVVGGEVVPVPGDPRWLAYIRQACMMGGRFNVPPDDRPAWTARIAELDGELIRQAPGYAQVARSLLDILLVQATRLALPGLGDVAEPVDATLVDILAVIDARYAEPSLSLAEVAVAVGRSPSQAGRVVRRLTGNTVGHWIEERRMLEARRLLLHDEAKVEVIGRRVGYPDPSYFRRRFRRVHGAPPQAWRQLNR